MNIQTISTIVGIFIGLGTMIAGCGFAYAQVKIGLDKTKDSLIVTLKDSLTLEQDKNKQLNDDRNKLIASHQIQITQIAKELAEFKGRFEEQVKKSEEYKQMLLDRDPRQQEVLAEIKGFLQELNVKALTVQTRNQGIDNATSNDTGHILRKK